MFRIFLGI